MSLRSALRDLLGASPYAELFDEHFRSERDGNEMPVIWFIQRFFFKKIY